jgi:hypothetical protein
MITILIHILPQEIDQLEQTLIQLKKSSKYINKNDKILVEVVLNCNLINWKQSKLDEDFFTKKLFRLEKLTKSWAETNFWVSKNNEVLGCTDSHRLAEKTYKPNAFLWLDVDIIFSDTLLYNIIESYKLIKDTEKYFIITPETTRLWDGTWDIITNGEALKEDASHKNYFDRDPYLTTGLMGEASLRKINTFKFASGWATLLSNDLIKKTIIPDEMGSYYMDDTFIMACCEYGKQKGFNASQYVLTNEIIIENNKFRYNHYENYLDTINRKDEFINIAQNNFNTSVNNFLNSL